MTNHPHDMAHILEKKVTACEDFLSATLLLKRALETEAMPTVDHLIGRRQELIRVIDGLDRLIGHYRHTGPSDKNQRIAGLSADLRRVLKQIMSANHGCDAIAAGRCEGLGKDIMNIRRQEEGLHGYSPAQEKTQKFLNIRT